MDTHILKSQSLSKRGKRRIRRNTLQAFLEACKVQGSKKKILTDGDGREFSYGELRQAIFALSSPLKKKTHGHKNIGILLPTGAGAVIALLSIHAAGRTPAMLNFTSGIKNLKAAIATAPLKTIVTARKFIEIAGLSALIEELSKAVNIVYLEDLREEIGLQGKLRAILGPISPQLFVPHQSPDDTGVILFTSGTEGNPKGVVLTHSNILANIEQIEEHVELEKTDKFFNPLPTFHCYGLTAGTLWPIFSGYPVVLHPSPLQTKTIAKRIFKTRSTVLFATDTFLQQYMRASADGGMNSLRIAVCGAERVREETRKTAEQRFSFEVLEGYGVTECAPVLAANQPGDIRAGTIGKMLPGIETRLEPVEGLEDAGCLWVRGPNIMKGYISADNPGKLVPLKDGWHNTGDVVSIDEEGYYVIRGRIKRFAKIGGEMVSLTVVENCASAVWPDNNHAAAIIPDSRKGEQIVLVTDHPEPKRHELMTWAKTHGVPEISVPKKVISVEALPVLGTGKLDYLSVTNIAKEFAAIS
ncbi:acyl-[acyl-carrier-protein]-phospholipid O-acyltransferase/long-chain-fatty-acid--[acyl-carrier-protein] ligase [Litorimonas taeanensis]|uniref:Acyl-[acyl-carrier-protein]-phospholipid O-acyltransferase/long-chain-fatty-acid--[acyl-carrier-protein] ligase n=1 Tax=Litorimonas taeanensis TaxID=568099 RepID=A0A420WDE6_9PROT|nr:AMP-binding protein [Litorimonas taeanensis]RKQ69031.1 acyl-[acyl-carrier-protein]-phospholipid O-acyltransferase/long-chain-fatty-acid--[acyl-carrier-protein] ligase [Litorimonas taeanensis]